MPKSKRGRSNASEIPFVADGHSRALKGIEAEVRPEIEQKYAEEWNRSGYLRRWFLLRKIDREVAARIQERIAEAPPDALY